MDMKLYKEYKFLQLPEVQEEILDFWRKENVFQRSIDEREGHPPFVFYEGPPSANGMPGIHHVLSRTIKDIFCRYKTQQGFQVKRKAGWDTHGLPVELGVEKELGITKEDIGKKISVEDYNKACREAVMRYTGKWNELTQVMGYWVNMDDPYITYKTKYIETVWWLLKRLYDKDLLYKGYTIQPYSPKAGTGLSSHELNQPGTYRNVKDTTIVAMFRAIPSDRTRDLWGDNEVHLLAWTTTPWTLPSNTALTVGPKIRYVRVRTFNQYTGEPIQVVLGEPLITKQFDHKFEQVESEDDLTYTTNDKKVPYFVAQTFEGSELVGIRYEQLLPFAKPFEGAENAFRVIPGDFVTTEDGTGIVHTAPTFGADDAKVAKEAGVPPMLVLDDNGNPVPLVDLQGRFVSQMGELAGKYVKNEYYDEGQAPEKSVDVEIAIRLKEEGKAFKVEKYEHTYPHCWRTDKPVLYYPLDSWFIRSTAAKDRLIELNKTINWKPESTGTGRFGNWLENLNDWNLSRSRYWGIPLPIWSTEEGDERKIIGSVGELKREIERAVQAGFMTSNPISGFEEGNMEDANYDQVDLHRPYADQITLVSSNGRPMKRESDLIDVWFDSGSMPYAQWHYPFENADLIDEEKFFPADFIAEGVDQTRGWFFTLHAIATMAFDKVAYKNVVSNGLVLDKNGHKMSKRLGNAVDPFETIGKYGADAVRWYMVTNAQPWDNLKFDLAGVEEVSRKFFGTLYNTYGFFAMYANLDAFKYQEDEVPIAERPEIDRWILSELNTLIRTVSDNMDDYEPTRAYRPLQDFVVEKLSNWYVRLCRKRFWKGEYGPDKIAAYQTLYTCLITVAKLGASLAPFYMERLYRDLNGITGKETANSVHLADFPSIQEDAIDPDLEERMQMAQELSSMVLALRKKERIKVRQPLQKMVVPVIDRHSKEQLEAVADLILSEVNVKEIQIVDGDSGIFVKKAKPNFKVLGPRVGKHMKTIAAALGKLSTEEINAFEAQGYLDIDLGNDENIRLENGEVEVSTQDIPGMLVSNEYGRTVALDISLTEDLKREGLARELVNRVQNLRKDSGLEITDQIRLTIERSGVLTEAVEANRDYIGMETLTTELILTDSVDGEDMEIDGIPTRLKVEKVS
ncbi:MAG: isoleucine--tRNA ligase [Bacteroidota bacterium]|nr:isoleucine--tRNA ligase [Bacteroidota bacterium]